MSLAGPFRGPESPPRCPSRRKKRPDDPNFLGMRPAEEYIEIKVRHSLGLVARLELVRAVL